MTFGELIVDLGAVVTIFVFALIYTELSKNKKEFSEKEDTEAIILAAVKHTEKMIEKKFKEKQLIDEKNDRDYRAYLEKIDRNSEANNTQIMASIRNLALVVESAVEYKHNLEIQKYQAFKKLKND